MRKLFLLFCILIGMTTQAQEKETMVLIKTNYGNIKVKLYNDTPLHRDNFIKLVKEGWYENSPFHRVINNFMIQGGGNAMVEKITDIPYLQNSKATISIKKALLPQRDSETK